MPRRSKDCSHPDQDTEAASGGMLAVAPPTSDAEHHQERLENRRVANVTSSSRVKRAEPQTDITPEQTGALRLLHRCWLQERELIHEDFLTANWFEPLCPEPLQKCFQSKKV